MCVRGQDLCAVRAVSQDSDRHKSKGDHHAALPVYNALWVKSPMRPVCISIVTLWLKCKINEIFSHIKNVGISIYLTFIYR